MVVVCGHVRGLSQGSRNGGSSSGSRVGSTMRRRCCQQPASFSLLE